MAWRLDGTYFESCSCDEVCPCTWSAFTAKATLDRCRALLAYHVDSGEIDGVDVSGLNFAIFLDTPPVMGEGNWRVGVYLDDTAIRPPGRTARGSPVRAARRAARDARPADRRNARRGEGADHLPAMMAAAIMSGSATASTWRRGLRRPRGPRPGSADERVPPVEYDADGCAGPCARACRHSGSTGGARGRAAFPRRSPGPGERTARACGSFRARGSGPAGRVSPP